MMPWLATLLSIVIFGTWTAPRTWVPGELVTASMMNVHVRDNFNSIRSEHFSVQRFRGLSMKRHPDAGTAASTVMLVHADEIVMDDATRLGPWDRVTADLSASGAGGLDTGAEAASTWYEVWAIAKDDGTKNLLLHRSHLYTQADIFTTAPDATRVLRLSTGTATDKLAQGIQFTSAGPLTYVDIPLDRDGAVASSSIWLTLQSDSSGNPSGSVLATSDKLNASFIELTAGYIRFVFRTPFSVLTSTQYHLVLEADYAKSDTVNIKWSGVNAGGYANGSAKQFNGAAWSAATGVGDFNFITGVTAGQASPTMPSGYTKKALVSQVYNNGSSNIEPFDQRENRISRGITIALSGFTGTIASLTAIPAIIPPHALSAWGMFSNGTAGSFILLGGVPSGHALSFLNQARDVQATCSTAGGFMPVPQFYVEYQAFYLLTNAGTMDLYVMGWKF